MPPMRKIPVWLLIVLLLQSIVYAHVEGGGDASGVGITPMLGHRVPLDLTFRDESGRAVKLEELIHTPVILALVYLHCPNVCSFLLQNLADVLNQMPAEPGRDYVALSVSFDETETPALAQEKKKLFLKMIDRPSYRGQGEYRRADRCRGVPFQEAGRRFPAPGGCHRSLFGREGYPVLVWPGSASF
jgi:hypothetical protein